MLEVLCCVYRDQQAEVPRAQASWLVSMVGARVGAAAAQAALEALCEEDPALAAEAGQASANGGASSAVPAAPGHCLGNPASCTAHFAGPHFVTRISGRQRQA